MGSFTVKYQGDKSQLLNKIKSTVGDKGHLEGDDSLGVFIGSTPVGKFEGSYMINGDDITINIDKKPFLVSDNKIKEEFEKALRKA